VGIGQGTHGRVKERGEGVIVPGTRVVRIDREEKGKGWVVQLETGWEGKEEGEKGEVEAVRADVVVNTAGLAAASLLEGIVPESEQVKMYPLKGEQNVVTAKKGEMEQSLIIGNYVSYKGPGVYFVSRLIYPCPSRDLGSLGTHLTFDLSGNIRFGPDAEPIGSPAAYSQNPDFWQDHLAPSAARIQSIGDAVLTYLPGIDPSLLEPDYSGIRPNISDKGFFDFMVRHGRDRQGLIECLGFASPGLTSSLAVGEMVAKMVRKDIWKEKASVEHLAEGWE